MRHESPTPRSSSSSSGRSSERSSGYYSDRLAEGGSDRFAGRSADRSYERASDRTRHAASEGRETRRSSSSDRGYSGRDYSDKGYSGRDAGRDAGTRRASYERGSHAGYSRDEYAAPKRSNAKRNLIIVGVVVLAVVLIGAIGAFAYVNSLSKNLHEGVDDNLKNALVETDMSKEPFYMLLLGTDKSKWREENQADMADTNRSDSMILARVDPVNKKVALISIHRDTMVDLGQYGEHKINAAYMYGGAAGAVEAVSKMAGVPISHYASVDFDGFADIVDSIGGVEVNVPIDIDDPDAGGSLSAGLQTLNGDQALVLCRSRHSYDDVASDGDVMRAANQRMVLSAIAKKVLASDILTIANTVQVISQYVTTDLELTDIIGLAQIMQGINPDEDIYTAMEPTASAYIDDTWYEYLDEAAWKEMIKRMDQGLPPVNKTEIDDATGTVLSTGGKDAPVV